MTLTTRPISDVKKSTRRRRKMNDTLAKVMMLSSTGQAVLMKQGAVTSLRNQAKALGLKLHQRQHDAPPKHFYVYLSGVPTVGTSVPNSGTVEGL